MTVRQIMNSNVVYLSPDDSALRAAKLLERHNIGMLPICTNERKIRGIVTDRDITLRCTAYDNPAEETRLRDIMTRGVVSVSPNVEIEDAARLMAKEQIRRLPVVENEKIIGIISLGDIAGHRCADAEVSKAIAEISLSKSNHRNKE